MENFRVVHGEEIEFFSSRPISTTFKVLLRSELRIICQRSSAQA